MTTLIAHVEFNHEPTRAELNRLARACSTARAKYKKIYGSTKGAIWFEAEDGRNPTDTLMDILCAARLSDADIVSMRNPTKTMAEFTPWKD